MLLSGLDPLRASRGLMLPTHPATAELILSITSIPERIELFLSQIAWVEHQIVQPRTTVIWLGEDSFSPTQRSELAQRFPLPPGVELRYRPDLGPQTKLLYALQEFPDLPIVTADDDTIYPPEWLALLANAHREAPQQIQCCRAHRIRLTDQGRLAPYRDWEWLAPGLRGPSPLLFPTGVSGVLYPPGSLSAEVFDHETMRRLCPTADDAWFKAMALLQGSSARKVHAESFTFPHIPGSECRMLWTINVERNDTQLAALFDYYQLYDQLHEAEHAE